MSKPENKNKKLLSKLLAGFAIIRDDGDDDLPDTRGVHQMKTTAHWRALSNKLMQRSILLNQEIGDLEDQMEEEDAKLEGAAAVDEEEHPDNTEFKKKLHADPRYHNLEMTLYNFFHYLRENVVKRTDKNWDKYFWEELNELPHDTRIIQLRIDQVDIFLKEA